MTTPPDHAGKPDTESLAAMENLYRGRWNEFGADRRSLGWTREKQMMRFAGLLQICPLEGRRILDLGCGFGDLVIYLEQRLEDFTYVGVDIVPEFIEEARRRHTGPNTTFTCADFHSFECDSEFDWVIGCGSLTYCHPDLNPYDHVVSVWENFGNRALEGMAFDFLSDSANYQAPQSVHYNPERLLQLARNRWPRVVLRQDYLPFELALIVFTSSDRDPETNRFFATTAPLDSIPENPTQGENRH